MQTINKSTIKDYKQALNKFIKKEQPKKLYEILMLHIPFIEDFRVSYSGYILKEYNLLEEENTKLDLFDGILEDKYPSFLELDIVYDIAENINELEQQNKQNTSSYKKLLKLSDKAQDIKKVFKRRYKVKSTFIKLQWKFTKLNLAITLTKMEEIPSYDEVIRLEKETRVICKELIKMVKKHDKSTTKLKEMLY